MRPRSHLNFSSFKLASSFVAGAVVLASIASPARAQFVVTIEQEGANVVVTGSGSINTTYLTSQGTLDTAGAGLEASSSNVTFAPSTSTEVSYYTYSSYSANPGAFGNGGLHAASTESGNVFVFDPAANPKSLYLPFNYVSGSALSETMTFNGTTLAGLGITPGTYNYTFGNGLGTDTVVIYAGIYPTPEPTSVKLAVFGAILLGAYGLRKRLESRFRAVAGSY